SFEATLGTGATGKYITATATDPFGNTSEFSVGVNALSTAAGAQFTVTTTADSGAGALRQAILDANGSAFSSRIVFAIAGGGPHFIIPATALPGISNTVTIDGYSQAGAAESSSSAVFNGLIKIAISGTNAPASTDLISVQWPGVVLRGLAIL